jgi:phosphohistidine phosphatase
MLIGHNPGLRELACDLVGNGDEVALERMQKKFPTGALATLILRERDWTGVGRGTCELHSFVVPGEL